jgi:hypothetical protein
VENYSYISLKHTKPKLGILSFNNYLLYRNDWTFWPSCVLLWYSIKQNLSLQLWRILAFYVSILWFDTPTHTPHNPHTPHTHTSHTPAHPPHTHTHTHTNTHTHKHTPHTHPTHTHHTHTPHTHPKHRQSPSAICHTNNPVSSLTLPSAVPRIWTEVIDRSIWNGQICEDFHKENNYFSDNE